MDKMQIECIENRVPRPNLYDGNFDINRNFEIDLNDDDLDVIKRSIDAAGFKGGGPAYPVAIQNAVDRVLMKIEATQGKKNYESTSENNDAFFRIFSGCILKSQ